MTSNVHSTPPTLHPPAGQYSHGVLVPPHASTLYIAGQVGMQADGTLADGLEAQVRQTFENLMAVLAANGMEPGDLVQLTYYLVNEDDVATLRTVRAAYLPEPPPASTAIVVRALLKDDWLFELDGVAARTFPA